MIYEQSQSLNEYLLNKTEQKTEMKNLWNKLAISLGDSFYSIILGRSGSLHFMIYFEKVYSFSDWSFVQLQ